MTRGRFFALLIGLGFAWRLVVNSRMVVPREDGVNYLWMAERFAEGQVEQALSMVFSPLLALLIAVPVALGVEPFHAAQLVLAMVGALVVLPIAAISEQLVPGTERIAALLAFVAFRLTMLGAEIYTEPLFVLVGGYAFLFGLRQRYCWCGALAGLAFWVRPEAALIPLVFLGRARVSWLPSLVTAALVAVLAGWRGACGHGFDPVPKLAFIAEYNVAGDTDAVGFALRSVGHLLEIPANLFSAYGALALLAIIGLFHVRPGPAIRLFAMAVVVICLYVPRWRFLVNWIFLIVPFAAVALRYLPRPGIWIALNIILHLCLSMRGGIDPNRIAERSIAVYLRQQLQPGQRVAGDMTRVHYFVGQRPLAPRHFTATELIIASRDARFVVLGTRRATTASVLAGLPDHQALELPEELQTLAEARGILVLYRN